MNSSLLPYNATPQERALAESVARLSDIPIDLRHIWNPDQCPVSFLPWLAWAFSVDTWNPDWSESKKREVIQNAYFVHQHKGTTEALRRGLSSIGYLLITAVEWFVEGANPYTFRVIIDGLQEVITSELYANIESIIDKSKNARSHLSGITVNRNINGTSYLASSVVSGLSSAIYPIQITEQSVSGGVYSVLGHYVADTVTVQPGS